MKFYMDYETYSSVDLKALGAYRYTESPDFLPLMLTYAWGDEPVQVTVEVAEMRAIIERALSDKRVTYLTAHNAQFERICSSRLLGMPTGKYLDPERWHDTMAVAAEKGRPQSLGALAKALGAEEKDTAGTRLINLFCKPHNGRRTLPEDKPEEWLDFVGYGVQDTETLRDVDVRLGGWPTEMERLTWCADQRVNDTGIKVDLDLVDVAVPTAAANAELHGSEVMRITGVTTPRSIPQLKAWLSSKGHPVDNLQAETVERMLQQPSLDPEVRRVLELRQELALVAFQKYEAAQLGVSPDGRLRGGFRFFGAHTGRWTGRGVQLQNLPRATIKSNLPKDAPEHAHVRRGEALVDEAILDLKLGLGADATTLKALVRAMFLGPFTVVDYAAIEARDVAWLAGETWALEAFAAGRDIYVETAERMSTPERPLTRSHGKVAVLALGYNGGVNSLRNMGAEGTDDELQTLVTQWRTANANIVGLWAEMDRVFRVGGSVGDHLTIERDGTSRHMRLPSGRAISYHGCKFTIEETRWGPKPRSSFIDPGKGIRVGTYGGRLIENATQAVARDILAEALVRLHRYGYRIAGHVHDEVLVEGVGSGSIQAVRAIMLDSPDWAKGLPLDAAGFTCARYRKG